MESPSFEKPAQPIASTESERAYLREQLRAEAGSIQKEHVERYQATPADQVLDSSFAIPGHEVEKIVLDLTPEEHDTKMNELIALAKERGIKNALSIVEKMNNPHVEDDFARYVIEYLKEGHSVTGLKERSPLFRALHMTLYEVTLPRADEEKQKLELRGVISAMEQFYSAMLSVGQKENKGAMHFAIELAQPNFQEEYSFFVAVPQDKEEMFEKHVLSLFPQAHIEIKKDDYNVFNEDGVSVASVATFDKEGIFPLKTYDTFDHDPLNVLLNSFSKIDRAGEGAALQIVLSADRSKETHKSYEKILGKIKDGTKVKEAIKGESVARDLAKEVFEFFKTKKKEEPDFTEKGPIDDVAVKNIEAKISAPIYFANIRIIASSRTEKEASDIISDIESSFNQLANTSGGNKLVFKRQKGRKLKAALKDFSFRYFDRGASIPLNTKELTTIFHFETTKIVSAPQLKKSNAKRVPAPSGIPSNGILLGSNIYHGAEHKAYMQTEDRLRHFYVIGQTGTGKSTLLKNMIIQDIQNGDGVCFIDPHGADIQDILSNVPPERYDDVIYFDPSHTERPMGLNMLEYNRNFPEQKTFVVNELFSIFQKLYGAVPESMGPMFEQYFRNATMLVIEDPDSGSTLLDVSRVLADAKYRALKLSRCKNPVVVEFWEKVAEKAGGEAALANIVPYITSKFDVFLANDIMRPIVAQEHSVFDFRKIMDERKILLVNLAKGRLGDINANLIGLIIVGKILMATLSRVDAYGKDVSPFYLYIDEFQNVTTNSISTILSEARKYKLGLLVAHQFIAQLEEEIRDSVFGNVGSMASFRVGSDDAEYLEKQFKPVFSAADLMNIDNFEAYIKLLVNGKPVAPFNVRLSPPIKGDADKVEKLKQLSFLTYGRPREEVEAEIFAKYRPSI